jgi:hypothetical protein
MGRFMPISADIFIEDLVEDYPASVAFLLERKIVCIKCGEPIWGTLRETLERSEIEDIDQFVQDLNEFLTS